MPQKKIRLTEALVRKLRTPGLTYDDLVPGFAVRVYPSGRKAFVLVYYVEGRERRLTIGAFPTWTPPQARERAKALRREIDYGCDPLAERNRRRGEPTFRGLVAEYFAIEGPRQKSAHEARRMVEKDAVAVWGDWKAKDVERRHVRELTERKAQAAPVAGNRLFQTLRRIFNFGVRRELLEASPCYLLSAPARDAERVRDRVLSETEILTLWNGMDGEGFTAQTAAGLRLILTTGARPGEVAGLEWRELDLDGGWWSLPASRAKNGLANRIPLNKLALAILRGIAPGPEWVFGSSRRPGPIGVRAMARAGRRTRERLSLEPWSPHDLRRSCATHLARAGVDEADIGKLLGHAPAGVTARHYVKDTFDQTKRRVSDLWERKLREILDGAEAASKVKVIEAKFGR